MLLLRSITSSRRGSLLGIVWSLVLWVILCDLLDAAATEMKNVVGTAGQNITLVTGLTGMGHSDLLWSFTTDGVRYTLASYFQGQLSTETMDRFIGRLYLDTGTGSLLITNLNLNDTGIYRGEVINGASSYYDFNLTVLSPVTASTELPSGISTEPPLMWTTSPPTNHSDGSYGAIVGGTLAAAVAVVIIIIIIFRRQLRSWITQCHARLSRPVCLPDELHTFQTSPV